MENVHHVVVNGLHLGGRMADAPGPGHVMKVPAVQRSRKDVEDNVATHHEYVAILADAVRQPGVASLGEYAAFRVFQAEFKLLDADEALDRTNHQRLALVV